MTRLSGSFLLCKSSIVVGNAAHEVYAAAVFRLLLRTTTYTIMHTVIT